jgi:hypothetical protein
MPRGEASRRARLEFGSIDNVTLDCREAKGLGAFDALQRHLRYAARLLRKSPAFTATTLATLALCLGANLAIFAVVDAILLRPLPFPAADHLVSIFNTYPKAGVPDDGSSVTNYYERRGHIAAFCKPRSYRDDAAIVARRARPSASTSCACSAGVLHDAWRPAGAWSSVHRRGDHVSDVGRGRRE